MRIGIMGGTFDPIHIGHLIAAECAREQAGLDEVWFMPTYVPPHKTDAPLASAEERLTMVRLAVDGNPSYRANDFELRKGGVSYTVDTMRQLKEEHPEYAFFFIVGGDMIDYLPKWHRIDELSQMIGFIGLARPGSVADVSRLPAGIAGAVRMAEMPLIEVSSTWIRGRIAAGRSIRYAVPEAVHAYIKEKRLYET